MQRCHLDDRLEVLWHPAPLGQPVYGLLDGGGGVGLEGAADRGQEVEVALEAVRVGRGRGVVCDEREARQVG